MNRGRLRDSPGPQRLDRPPSPTSTRRLSRRSGSGVTARSRGPTPTSTSTESTSSEAGEAPGRTRPRLITRHLEGSLATALKRHPCALTTSHRPRSFAHGFFAKASFILCNPSKLSSGRHTCAVGVKELSPSIARWKTRCDVRAVLIIEIVLFELTIFVIRRLANPLKLV